VASCAPISNFFSLGRGRIEFAKWQHPKDYFRPFHQQLVDDLRTFIRPGDTVLDIGAHCGDFSLPLALACGSEGCVFAWEPNPYVFDVLCQNASLNKEKTNIVAVQAAATNVEGPIEFSYSDPGFCNGGCLDGISKWKHGHPFKLTVNGLRVLNWMQENYPQRMDRLSFIKIDAEGFDLTVVQSMRELIAIKRPRLHVEMYRHLDITKRQSLWEELVNLGYEVFRTGDGYGCLPTEKLDKRDLCKWPHYDVLAIPA
jgi:FkbM family methyltransferase